MSFRLLVSDSDRSQIEPKALQQLASVYSAQYPQLQVSADISLIDTEKIRTLNREQRGIDEATDVLSFPTLATLAAITEQATGTEVLIGSIVICPEKAQSYGETLPQLVHHGLLHLLGFDHETDRAAWDTEEQRLLNELGKQGLFIEGVPHD